MLILLIINDLFVDVPERFCPIYLTFFPCVCVCVAYVPTIELGCGLGVTLALMLMMFVIYHVFWLELLLLYRSWFGSDERYTGENTQTRTLTVFYDFM